MDDDSYSHVLHIEGQLLIHQSTVLVSSDNSISMMVIVDAPQLGKMSIGLAAADLQDRCPQILGIVTMHMRINNLSVSTTIEVKMRSPNSKTTNLNHPTLKRIIITDLMIQMMIGRTN